MYKGEVEGLLRGWTAVAASLLQLAAYTCGDGEPTGALSIRSSAASDENCNAANRDISGLLAPDAAAAALQKGAAGAPVRMPCVRNACVRCRMRCMLSVDAHLCRRGAGPVRAVGKGGGAGEGPRQGRLAGGAAKGPHAAHRDGVGPAHVAQRVQPWHVRGLRGGGIWLRRRAGVVEARGIEIAVA